MDKKKLYTGIIMGLLAFILVSSIVISIGIGDKEINEFNSGEKAVFIGFWVSLAFSMAGIIFYGVKFDKINKSNRQQVKPTQQDKALTRRNLLLWVAAFAATLASIVIGGVIYNNYNIVTGAKALFIASCLIPPVLVAVSALLNKRYKKRLQSYKPEEIQALFLSRRELADKSFKQESRFLRVWMGLSNAYAALLAVLAFMAALGMFYINFNNTLLSLYSVFIFRCAFSQVRLPVTKALMGDETTYVKKEDFPHLYSLAEGAMEKTGCKGEVRIYIIPNDNAGIAVFGRIYTLNIGVTLFGILSEAELFSVLLHEFAHTKNIKHMDFKEMKYAEKLDVNSQMAGNKYRGLFFEYLDNVYAFHYMIFQYAISIIKEQEADQLMAALTDKATIASALLKIRFLQLYIWEEGSHDFESIYKPETMSREYITQQIEAFKSRMAENAEKWAALTEVEILSRSSSHPTVKVRLQALGITDYAVLEDNSSKEYLQERAKAISYWDEIIYNENKDSYLTDREELYLKPLNKVSQWEEAGKPLLAAEYRDIVEALQALGRVSEAENLCTRAINELPDSASAYAYAWKGQLLLCRYDPAGIPMLYHAMEQNSNYTEEALNKIGEFCCITGNQAELDNYRERVNGLMQQYIDKNNRLDGLNKGDRLLEHNLSQEELEQLVEFIKGISNGAVNQVYLVNKEIAQEQFSSVVIAKFEENAPEDALGEVLTRLFNFLDVSPRQYSLFIYDHSMKSLGIEKIQGSLIYEAKK